MGMEMGVFGVVGMGIGLVGGFGATGMDTVVFWGHGDGHCGVLRSQ